MRRIWFKKDCVKWIREGKKTTTFRSLKKEGIYGVVQGSYYRSEFIGLDLVLTVIKPALEHTVIHEHFSTEGDFRTVDDFKEWLHTNKLVLPQFGYLHDVFVVPKIPAILAEEEHII